MSEGERKEGVQGEVTEQPIQSEIEKPVVVVKTGGISPAPSLLSLGSRRFSIASGGSRAEELQFQLEMKRMEMEMEERKAEREVTERR